MSRESVGIYFIAHSVNPAILEQSQRLFSPRRINVVTTATALKHLETTRWPAVNFINENDILAKRTLQHELAAFGHHTWYYQQLLKYQTVLSAPYEHVHIIDGDSITTPVWSTPGLLATTGKPPQHRYSTFSRSAIGVCCTKYSFVTNQMVFNRNTLDQMLRIVARGDETRSWIHRIITIMRHEPLAMFSEYQLYGDYVHCIHNTQPTKIRLFRRMDCVNQSPASALQKYDLIAYEPHHRTGLLRILRARVLYRLGLSLG